MSNQNRSRQSRRGRSNRSSTSAVVTRAQLKRDNHSIENGVKLRPGPHPTDFETIPWFSLTVQIPNANNIHLGATTTTGSVSLFAALAAQLGVTAAVSVRIQNLRVWGPLVSMNAAASLQPIRAQFANLTTSPSATGPAPLEDIISYPDQVSRAALGFAWPKAQQSLSLSTAPTSVPIVVYTSGGGAGTVTYVRLLWRPFALFGQTYDLA